MTKQTFNKTSSIWQNEFWINSTQMFVTHIKDLKEPNKLVVNTGIWSFSSVQSLSRVRLFATPWAAACQVSLSITNTWSLPKLMSIESVMPSNHLIFRRPLLLLPLIFPNIRVFSNESALCISGQNTGVSAYFPAIPHSVDFWKYF